MILIKCDFDNPYLVKDKFVNKIMILYFIDMINYYDSEASHSVGVRFFEVACKRSTRAQPGPNLQVTWNYLNARLLRFARNKDCRARPS